MPTQGQAQLQAEIAARIGYGIKRVEQLLVQEKTRMLRPFGLTLPQYVTLMALHYVPGQSAAQLARTALVSSQTIATVLGNLEKKQLVSRVISSLHARVLVNELTPAGRKLALAADRVVRGVEDDLRAEFTDAEFDQLQGFMARAERRLGSVKVDA